MFGNENNSDSKCRDVMVSCWLPQIFKLERTKNRWQIKLKACQNHWGLSPTSESSSIPLYLIQLTYSFLPSSPHVVSFKFYLVNLPWYAMWHDVVNSTFCLVNDIPPELFADFISFPIYIIFGFRLPNMGISSPCLLWQTPSQFLS